MKHKIGAGLMAALVLAGCTDPRGAAEPVAAVVTRDALVITLSDGRGCRLAAPEGAPPAQGWAGDLFDCPPVRAAEVALLPARPGTQALIAPVGEGPLTLHPRPGVGHGVVRVWTDRGLYLFAS